LFRRATYKGTYVEAFESAKEGGSREGKVPCAPDQEIPFFGSRVLGFWETRLVWISAPTRLSLRGSHVRRKFRKRTTLRSESSTLIGLLYAGWRSRCECSEECRTIALERSVSEKAVICDKRQSTFFHELEILWWFPAWAVLRSLANARKCQLEDFCEKERYESCSVERTCIADAFRKVRKGENVPVVLLLLGYTSVLLLRNPCVLYQKHGGACPMY